MMRTRFMDGAIAAQQLDRACVAQPSPSLLPCVFACASDASPGYVQTDATGHDPAAMPVDVSVASCLKVGGSCLRLAWSIPPLLLLDEDDVLMLMWHFCLSLCFPAYACVYLNLISSPRLPCIRLRHCC